MGVLLGCFFFLFGGFVFFFSFSLSFFYFLQVYRMATNNAITMNHCDKWGSRPTGKVRVSSGRFDHTEPTRTTVMKGEAGLKGSLE